MEIVDAWNQLGVDASADKAAVRAAFRRQILGLHPDLVGAAGTEPTRLLLAAYRTALDLAPEVLNGPGASVSGPNNERGNETPPVVGGSANAKAWLIDRDTIALDCSHDEAFVRLLEVGSALGVITYLDRQGELLEILLRTKLGDTLSLVVSFQGRAHWVEAFLTCEVLDVARHVLPSIDDLTELVLHELRQRW